MPQCLSVNHQRPLLEGSDDRILEALSPLNFFGYAY